MVIVLLVAYVFTSKVYAESTDNLIRSQQETSKIKTQLESVQSEKDKLETESKSKDAKIQQLEQENAELKG